MTLTEKWKKGEIKQGEYWCKITESPYIERVYIPCCDDIIVEVLAPVPSYEELQQMKEDNRLFEDKIQNSYQEIGKLRQLLKECKEILEVLKYGSINDLTASRQPARNLLTKINAAIGESEE